MALPTLNGIDPSVHAPCGVFWEPDCIKCPNKDHIPADLRVCVVFKNVRQGLTMNPETTDKVLRAGSMPLVKGKSPIGRNSKGTKRCFSTSTSELSR